MITSSYSPVQHTVLKERDDNWWVKLLWVTEHNSTWVVEPVKVCASHLEIQSILWWFPKQTQTLVINLSNCLGSSYSHFKLRSCRKFKRVVILIVFATFEEFVNYSWIQYDLSCRLDDVGLLGNPRDIEVKIIKNGEKTIALSVCQLWLSERRPDLVFWFGEGVNPVVSPSRKIQPVECQNLQRVTLTLPDIFSLKIPTIVDNWWLLFTTKH